MDLDELYSSVAHAVNSTRHNRSELYDLTLDPSRRRAAINGTLSVLKDQVNAYRDELPRETAVEILKHLAEAIALLDE